MSTLACPWSQLEPAKIHFCEKSLCAWIAQPSNAWSNLGFVLVGIWIIIKARSESRKHLAAIGIFSIMTGLGSFAFHATNSFIGEVFDEGSMFLSSLMMLGLNLERLIKWPGRRTLQFFVATSVLSLIALIRFKAIGVPLFGIQLASALGIELKLYLMHKRSGGRRWTYKPLLYFCVCFLVAWGIWWLDITHVLCNPDHHFITGHAVWHVMNSLNFWFAYVFYRQFYPAPAHAA